MSSEPQLLVMMLDVDAIKAVTVVATLTMATSLVGHTGISPRWQPTAGKLLSPVDAKQADVSPMSQASWPGASRGLDIF